MSKLQLITKAIITAIGINEVVYMLYTADIVGPSHSSNINIIYILSLLVLWLIIFILLVRWVVFDNDWIVLRIADGEQPLESMQVQRAILCSTMRIALVFLGILLLPSSLSDCLFLLEQIPERGLRSWVDGVFGGYYTWGNAMYGFFENFSKAMLIVLNYFLLTGFGWLVNWHVKRLSV